MIFDGNVSEYIWKDKDAFNTNKQADEVWMDYWARWVKAENIIFTQTYVEIQ
jgi:hypothetical protein